MIFCIFFKLKFLYYFRIKIKKIDVYQFNDIAIKNGFEIHHAKNDVLVLKLWFDETKHDNFPSFSTHNVGCGRAVDNN